MMRNVFITRRWALPALLGGLLACQSNSAETRLLRLYLVTDELMAVNDKLTAANGAAVKSIKEMVAKAHNQPKDVAVLRQSQAVRTETQQLTAYLRGLRQQLSPAGKAPTLAQLAEHQAVAEVLLHTGQADTLQRRLDRYDTFVRRYIGYGTTAPLTAAGADPRVRAIVGAEQAGQSFRELYFQDASVAGARAVLARQEAAVLLLESEALSELSKKVGSECLCFDKIGIFASAESNTVAEGETYRAEMFLTAAASGARPRMTFNGQPLNVGPEGKGQVRLTAPRLPAGQSRQTLYWEGTITILNDGRDTTFRLRVPYTVVRRP